MAKLHLIGNAHLDPVWLWRWQEGFGEILATFNSALERMKEFPTFRFTSACSCYYEWVEKMDPEMFEEIRQRVKEGRWNLVGGWFLQPDCNIPSGESFARQGLIGQRYFQEKFGVTAKTGYNVDSFGHNASLPQILKKSGMDNYVFMRPMPNEKELKEDVFLWESADGSRVCTYRIPETYCIRRGENLELLRKIKKKSEEKDLDYMAFVGVGNHGGGPTIKLIHEIEELGLDDTFYSSPDDYFKGIDQEKLPVVTEDLQHHARGCYSAGTFIKTNHRKCENNLLTAEKLCSLAHHLTGAKYPKEKFRKAWKNLLFNEFHDILAGCVIKKGYEDAGYLYGEIMSITEQAIYMAMQSIACKIDTLQGEVLPGYKIDNGRGNLSKLWEHEVLGTPVVVFNPHTWSVKMPVEINLMPRKITDERGMEVPFQCVRGDQTNGNDKYHTLFLAEIESMGYRVYRVFMERECEQTFERKIIAKDTVLENSRIRVEFSPVTGDICSFYDKRTKQYLISQECKAVLLDETKADTWAHNLDTLGETEDVFRNPRFSVIEEGNVQSTIRVVTTCQNSVLQRDYSIVADSETVLVKTKVDFHEKHRTLKFAFPLGCDEVIAKIPYGTICKKKGQGEEPCGSWIASGDIAVANDCKYGYDTTENEMRLTVLRSAIYADHYGVRDEFCEYMEQGIHEFSYSVFPYKNNADAERHAEELNVTLKPLIECFHDGPLEERYCGFDINVDGIIVTAIKQAEDDEMEVFRFCEMNGEPVNTTMNLFGKSFNAEVSRNEVKTFKMDGMEVNLIEWKH